MPFQQLFVLAIAGMVFLAVLRIVRVQTGRTPHPSGKAGLLFPVAFVALPPIRARCADRSWGGGSGALPASRGSRCTKLYHAGRADGRDADRRRGHRRGHRTEAAATLLLLAFVANEKGRSLRHAVQPARDAASRRDLDARRPDQRRLLPQGDGFRDQVDREGFRGAWDALDEATGQLEGAMAEDVRLGRGVPSRGRRHGQGCPWSSGHPPAVRGRRRPVLGGGVVPRRPDGSGRADGWLAASPELPDAGSATGCHWNVRPDPRCRADHDLAGGSIARAHRSDHQQFGSCAAASRLIAEARSPSPVVSWTRRCVSSSHAAQQSWRSSGPTRSRPDPDVPSRGRPRRRPTRRCSRSATSAR